MALPRVAPALAAVPVTHEDTRELEAEVLRLRRGMRDLAAITLLHGLWDGRSVADIADGLCGTVYRLLDLDASVVRVEGVRGTTVVSYPPSGVDADAVLARGEQVLSASDGLVEGSGTAAHRVDLDGIRALAVGVASRAGFPTDVEAMIFRAVANEASIAARASGRLEAARAANQTLESVVQQMPIGVAVAVASSGQLVLLNAALDALLVTCSGGAGEATFHDLDATRADGTPYTPGTWPLDRSLATGEVVHEEEVVVRAAEGRQFVLSISSVPIRDVSGAVVAAVATVDDISGRKDTEALRDAFISMLSHELRTPVTTIYAGSQLLRRRTALDAPDGGGGSSRELLDDIALEAERLDRIVQNFLVLARVERGAQVRGHEPVLIQRLVPRAVERERSRWADRSIVADLPPGMPPVGADEASVELVVRNLVNNAAKYGGPGVHVVVTAERREREIAVRVLDDGPGLTPEEAARVFDLFYRSSRVSGSAEGAGIGLYAVNAAIAAMGGTTWACGRPEGGAEFGFTLPVWSEEAEDAAR